jgi:tetratricopeptide (TPR) repeat protein
MSRKQRRHDKFLEDFQRDAQAETRQEASDLTEQGMLLMKRGQHRGAFEMFEKAASQFSWLGDQREEAIAISNAGTALLEMNLNRQAREYQERAIGLMAAVGDRHEEGRMRMLLGTVHVGSAHFSDAVTAFQAAVDTCHQTRDWRLELPALGYLGAALLFARRFDEAVAVRERALVVAREQANGDPALVSAGLTDLGLTLHAAGRSSEAILVLEDAVKRAQEAGNPAVVTAARDRLADVRADRPAITDDVVERKRSDDPVHRRGDELNDHGLFLLRMERDAAALEAFRAAVAIFQQVGDRRDEAVALCNVGLALNGQRKRVEAVEALERATELAAAAGDEKLRIRIGGHLDQVRAGHP